MVLHPPLVGTWWHPCPAGAPWPIPTSPSPHPGVPKSCSTGVLEPCPPLLSPHAVPYGPRSFLPPFSPVSPRAGFPPPPPNMSPSPVTPLMSPGVLEESEDVLVNVTLVAEEQAQENAELRKKKPPYIPYEDEDPAAATQVRPLLVSPRVPCMSPLLQARHPALSRVFL